MDGVTDFMNSNSTVARVAFLILVLIMFVVLLRIGTGILVWFFSPSPNPYLIKRHDKWETDDAHPTRPF